VEAWNARSKPSGVSPAQNLAPQAISTLSVASLAPLLQLSWPFAQRYDRKQVARMRRVNVDGLIHATCAVIGSMRAQRYGRIVNVASIAGIGTALSGNAFYAATRYWPVFGPAGPF
jgi:NAD(P)-dependent dehydrogenase (short-subunit alcohol dehydrogenase family)